MLSSATALCTLYFLPVAVWPFTLPLENTSLVWALNVYVTPSWRKYLHTFMLHTFRATHFEVQLQIALPFHEQMVHCRRRGLSKRVIYCMKPEEKEVLVTLSLAAAQRFCCSPPMIRWVVHPEDVRAFSCGVTAACACLSCGRRWLRVGGGCCQMMAPGGAMCEMKVGGEWGRKK